MRERRNRKVYVPSMLGYGRPHMVLPSEERYNAMMDCLALLLKLDIINNWEGVRNMPTVSVGKTYYHCRIRNRLIHFLYLLGIRE